MNLYAQIIARKRIIDRLDLSSGKGVIVADARLFEITFDDVLDLTQAVEMIMLKLTGKVLDHRRRPLVTNRTALKALSIVGGDFSLGPTPAPVLAMQKCDVTDVLMQTHFLRIELADAVFENWICRLDELIKALYILIADVQSPPLHIAASKRAPRQRYQAPGSALIH